jgi:hypothetical protein
MHGLLLLLGHVGHWFFRAIRGLGELAFVPIRAVARHAYGQTCVRVRTAPLVLVRTRRRALTPVAWVTRYKTICRQFARPLP